jgi:PAS domain-containing protein
MNTAGDQKHSFLDEMVEGDKDLVRKDRLHSSIVDNIPDFIYVKNRESRFLYANPVVVFSMGLQFQDELIGKIDFEFLPGHLAERFLSMSRPLSTLEYL